MRQKLWPLVGFPRGKQAGVLLLALLSTSSAVSAAAPDVRYLALGDSFTAGTGSKASDAFPRKLAARWKQAGLRVELENPARNGFTTDDLIEDELPLLQTFKPNLVSVAIGANDLVRGRDENQYRAQLKKIFKAILAAGVAPDRIFALPQPAWSESPAAEMFGDRAALRAKISRFNDILKEEAKLIGARYIDLWPYMLENAEKVSEDGLHPSAASYDAWALQIAKAFPLK